MLVTGTREQICEDVIILSRANVCDVPYFIIFTLKESFLKNTRFYGKGLQAPYKYVMKICKMLISYVKLDHAYVVP